MARTHLAITVELVSGGQHAALWPRPGRIVIASRSATFAQLAEAIDHAFAVETAATCTSSRSQMAL